MTPDLPRGPAGPPRRPEPADRRRPLVARRPGRRAGATTPRRTCPGAIFVDVDTDLAAPRARAGTRSPPRPPSRARMARARVRRRQRHRRLRRRGRHDRRAAVVDARRPRPRRRPPARRRDPGVDARSAGALTADVPSPPPGRLTLADAWSRTIDAGRARRAARERRRHRRPRAGALPRRGRAGRPRRGPHPDGAQPPERRQPRRRTAASSTPDALRARFAPLGDEVVVVLRQRRHGVPQRARDAGRRPAGSPALRRARTATGPAPGGRSRRATSRVPPIRRLGRATAARARAVDRRLRTHDGGLQAGRDQRRREPDREVAEQRDLEPEQRDLGADRQPQLVADQVERPERRRSPG